MSNILGLVGAAADASHTAPPHQAAAGMLKVYYLDVGQGDSTLIKTPKGQHILIDGGDNPKGQNVVENLESLGVKQLDAVIATHPDADHIG